MNGAEQIIVIILASFLALFLLLSIAAMIIVIKLFGQLRRITDRAELIAEQAEAVTSFVGKTAGPVAFGKLLYGIVESVREQTKRGKKDGK